MIVILQRLVQTGNGTFGVMHSGGEILCTTCEDPWNGNKPLVSCVPAGQYHCIPHDSQKFPGVWELEGVPGRSAVLIHNGNTVRDTEGCILVGDGYGIIGSLPAVTNSIAKLTRLKGQLPHEFTIDIRDPA